MEYYVNLNALRGKVIEKCKTVQNFATLLGCSYTHMLDILNGKSKVTLTNAQKMTSILELDKEEIWRIFFCPRN